MLPFLLERMGVANTAHRGQGPGHRALRLLRRRRGVAGRDRLDRAAHPRIPPAAEAFDEGAAAGGTARHPTPPSARWASRPCWQAPPAWVVASRSLDKALYIPPGCPAGFAWPSCCAPGWLPDNAFTRIIDDIRHAPVPTPGFAVVQFFSWFALFAMWITTAADRGAFRQHRRHLRRLQRRQLSACCSRPTTGSPRWLRSPIPWMVRRIKAPATPGEFGFRRLGCCRCCGIRDPHWLLLSMAGVGFAWHDPVAALCAAVRQRARREDGRCTWAARFRHQIIPQLVAAPSLLELLLNTLLRGHAISALAIGGVQHDRRQHCACSLVRAPTTITA